MKWGVAQIPRSQPKDIGRTGPPGGEFLNPRWAAAGLLLACFLAFLPALRAGFIWDDDLLITGNPLVHSAAGLPAIWRGEVNPDYLPLTSTLFWLEYRLCGAAPAGYHAVNILLHGLAAILLWRVLARLRIPLAWWGALLFAVHPVAASSVAWVAEGKNTLSALLAFASILFYLRFRDSGSRAWRDWGLSLGLFLLALLSKSGVVTVPLVLLLLDWWRRERPSPARYLHAAPFFLLSLVFGLVAVWFQNARAIGGAPIPIGGPLERLCSAGKALCFYAFQALFPARLEIIYPGWHDGPPGLFDFLPAAAILAALAAAWRFRQKPACRAFFFGFGAYALLLLPVLGFVPMYYFVFAPVADHLQYFALPAMVVLGLAALRALAVRAGPVIARLLPWGLGFAAIALGCASFAQSEAYRDPDTFWSFALSQTPDSFQVHYAYALVLLGRGELGSAIEHASLAARENPSFVKGHLNLALMLDRARRFDEAAAEYRAALQLSPGIPDAHVGLGNVLVEAGNPDAAAAEYREAIRLDPANINAHNNLGVVLQNAGYTAEGAAELNIAARLRNR